MNQTRTKDGQHRIDIELDHTKYLSYYDDTWIDKVVRQLPNGSGISELVLDFVVDLRGSIHVSAGPVKMLLGIQSFYNGFIVDKSPTSVLLKMMNVIMVRLTMEMDGGCGTLRDDNKIKQTLIRLGSEYLEMDPKLLEAVTVDMLWNHMRKDKYFTLSVWYAQRTSFVSLLNSYEYFLVTATKVALGIDELRSGDKDKFVDVLNNTWGEAAVNTIWKSSEMIEFMNVRHALTHAGGRLTKQTKSIHNRYHVIDETIHITPGNIAKLIHTLQRNVDEVVQVCPKHQKLWTTAT